MRSLLLVTFVLLLAGCGTDTKKSSVVKTESRDSIGTAQSDEEIQQGGDSEQPEKPATENKFWEKLVMAELRDNNGAVAAVMPMPSSWQLVPAGSQGGTSLTGPNGVRVTDFPTQSFLMNYNQNIAHAYAGQKMREMPGVEQLIQQDLVPWGQNQGLQFVRFYEIPEISKMDKWYSDQLYKALPARSEVAAFGTDWQTAEGKPYFMLLHINVATSQTLQTWYYRVSGLEAEPEHFDKARKQLIFALSNMRYNLQPIMVYNREEAQRCGQSWAAHNQRMAQNQAAFEAHQRAHVNKSNAINDAIMSGWRERNAASDRNQERTIDGIYERTNVVDPSTGKGYKVDAGANQYWMNSNGEYIGTQLQDYNPNMDDNLNGQKWQQLQQRKD